MYKLLSALGGPRARTVYVTLLASALAARGHGLRARFLVLAVAGTGALNTLFKEIIARRRPHRYPRFASASGYSFPSGHSSGSLAFAGALTYLFWDSSLRPLAGPIALAGAGFAGLVGASRVILHQHYRTDVFAGYGMATLWLALVVRAFRRSRHYPSAD